MWILLTLMAAFMQAWRNAFQSQLSKEVSVGGVTLARFLWAWPIALVYLIGLYTWHDPGIPEFNQPFVRFVLGAACMQIFATVLMVILFKLQNFAIGAGLAKSEAIVAAVLGVIFFGTSLSWLGWAGVIVGAIAVFFMSSKQGLKNLSLPTALLGLGCGTAFALTSLWIREASLCLAVPFPYSAAWVLVFVIGIQTLLLLTYLGVRDRDSLYALWQRPKLTLLTSIASCLGSIGWFSAMSLQAVPYVKTLGQVEVFFTLLIATLWLKDRVQIKDMFCLVLIAVAAVMVIWG